MVLPSIQRMDIHCVILLLLCVAFKVPPHHVPFIASKCPLDLPEMRVVYVLRAERTPVSLVGAALALFPLLAFILLLQVCAPRDVQWLHKAAEELT